AEMNALDPYLYPLVGFIAAINRQYGSGARAYFTQYGASLADNSITNVMTTAVLPSLLNQDPRYFERGNGRVLSRIIDAGSRVAVTRGDSGQRQVNVSELAGTAATAVMANAYYPAANNALPSTLRRWGMQLMWDAASNELREFWPEVRRWIQRRR